jgi:hypothetical protein
VTACPTCGAEDPERAQFCMECGASTASGELGRKLLDKSPVGTRIELASELGKVHWIWEDKDGERICRSLMLDSALDLRPDGPSPWKVFAGSESEFRLRQCRHCRDWDGG